MELAFRAALPDTTSGHTVADDEDALYASGVQPMSERLLGRWNPEAEAGM